MSARYLVFTAAMGGYEIAFRNNIASHSDYASRHGYAYHCFTADHDPALSREVTWIKVPLLIGALESGYDGALFVDADARITETCPPFHELFDDDGDLYLAHGHSGRVNAGVIIVRRTNSAIEILKTILGSVGGYLPNTQSAGWGENGYFIRHTSNYPGYRFIPQIWNNTTDLDIPSHIYHFTGPLRSAYPFDEVELHQWNAIQKRDKVAGEAYLADRFAFFRSLKRSYNDAIRDAPEMKTFDPGWCGLAAARFHAAPEALCIHMCMDIGADDPNNPYVAELVRGLGRLRSNLKVLTGLEFFWTGTYAGVDILHIQWAEVLCKWNKPEPELLAQIEERLKEISRTTRIVFTVHNLELKADFDEAADILLDIVGRMASAFIHLSKSSIEVFSSRYKKQSWVRERPHFVIGHGDYDYYRRIPQIPFRTHIAQDAKKVLVFGNIRTEAELDLSLKVAERLRQEKIATVIAGPMSSKVLSRKEIKRLAEAREELLHRDHRKVPSNQVASLMESADVIFLPRAERLNSGVLFLGYNFLKPVIAPAIHSMAEAQKSVGGRCYRQGDSAAAVRAIVDTLNAGPIERLSLTTRMFRFKHTEMNWSVIAREHLDAYESVLKSASARRTSGSIGFEAEASTEILETWA